MINAADGISDKTRAVNQKSTSCSVTRRALVQNFPAFPDFLTCRKNMLQHPAPDFYDLSTSAAVVNSRQTTPPYSPTGVAAVVPSAHNNNNNNHSNNNNNNTTSNNNNSGGNGALEIMGHNGTTATGGHVGVGGTTGGAGGGGNGNSGGRETLPSFGFTQEQVACVCEVS